MGRVRRGLWVALLIYSAVIAVALLAPTSGVQSALVERVRDLGVALGVSPAVATPGRAEFLANIAIIVPISALGSLLWPRSRWRDWCALGFVAACAVELTQGLALSLRSATTSDVVANTLGALAGAVLVALVRRLGWLPAPAAR